MLLKPLRGLQHKWLRKLGGGIGFAGLVANAYSVEKSGRRR